MDEDLIEIEEETKEIEEAEETPEVQLATVSAVTANGIQLTIDGADSATGKEYKCNTSINFQPGDRVKISKDSGSYIVECVVGKPLDDYPIPKGGALGQVLAKRNGTDFSLEWADPGGLPSGGTSGQVLTKNSSAAGDASWKTPTAPDTDKLVSGSNQVKLEGSTLKPNSSSIDLGSSSSTFNNCYLCTNGWSSRLGFFGSYGATRQTVSSSATTAELIQALKNYGLIN